MPYKIDYEKLWNIARDQFPLDRDSFHGWLHWKSVEKNGLILLEHTGADIDIVELFAIFHDSKRENEGKDPEHGKRGAEFAQSLRYKYFNLEDAQFEKLIYACTWHNKHMTTNDPDIGTCWDADRLDLIRIGIIPHTDRLNTDYAKKLVIEKY